jgi:Zn-finger nucleic acid-binding protein
MSSADAAQCPRDGSALILCSLSGCSYWWCPDCHGLLLEPEQLLQLRERAAARLPPPHSEPRLHLANARGDSVRCVCAGAPAMSPARHAEVVIDVCCNCGRTWLDGGEIHQLLQPALFTATVASSDQLSAGSATADLALEGLLEVASAVLELVGSAIDL